MDPLPPGMTLHQVLDRRHRNLVAWAFAHPRGWTAGSDLTWTFEDSSWPVSSGAFAQSPDGAAAFEFLPPEACYWLEPDMGACRPGARELGLTCLPPMAPVEMLLRWVVPKYSAGRANLQIRGAGPAPGLAQEVRLDTQGLPAEGAAVRLDYHEGGAAWEEEVYGVQVLQRVPYDGPMGRMFQINWGMARLFRYRAPQGILDARRDEFWAIARSARVNPAWEQLKAQILRQLQIQFDQFLAQGYAQIQAAGQLSRAISAHNDQLLAGWEAQRQAEHAAAQTSRQERREERPDPFGEYIRGDETYHDPYWGESRQDSNYQYHWTDGQGTYKSSNDPFFNPNLDSNQNWTLMEPK